MGMTSASVAAGVAARAKNVTLTPVAANVEQKILLIGTALASATGYSAGVPVQVYSAEDAGNRAGFGSELHRVAKKVFAAHGGAIKTYIAIQAESGTGVAATGTLAITGSPTEAGYLNVYIAGDLYQIAVSTTSTPTTLGAALVAAMAADTGCPLTGVNTTGSVAMTAKAKGTFYNDVNMSLNWGVGEKTPSGLTVTITPMASGANDPTISSVTTILGTDDLANEDFFTKILCCYGRNVAGTLNGLSTYNGTGNLDEGCWSKTCGRPFVALSGDTTAGSGGLTAILAIANGRTTDRTNGSISVPGSPNHPQEIAGLALGYAALVHQDRPEENLNGQVLSGIIPGARADQWTATYANRDTAARSGVSPTVVENGVVKMTNLLTYYHPADVAISSNGYRSMRNVSILQNIIANVKARFQLPKWLGISIVADISKVSNATARAKARSVGSVYDELFSLADQFEAKAWIFTAAYTKENLSVALRSGGLGFDNVFPLYLSGEGGIVDTEVQFDTNISVIA